MKRKLFFRRAKAAALAGLMAAGCLLFGPKADAADITIDTSRFKDPTVDHINIYQWKEGIPGYDWNKTFSKKFPVLMTWDDKYYFKVNQGVADAMRYNVAGNSNAMFHGWSENKKDSGYVNGSFDADGQYPHGYFMQNLGYPGSLLSDLDEVDFDLLQSTGRYISLSLPEGIPNLIPTWPSNEGFRTDSTYPYDRMFKNVRYAIEIDLPYTYAWYSQDYEGNYYTDGGLRQGENFLVGVRRDMCKHTKEGKNCTQSTGFYWSLYALNELTAKNAKTANLWFNDVLFTNRDFEYYKNHQYNSYNGVHHYCWYGAERSSGGKKYQCFWTTGFWIHGNPYDLCKDHSDYNKLTDLVGRKPQIALSHYDGNFETRGNWGGNDVLDTFNGSRTLWEANQNSFSFRCFYAEPLTVSIIRQDYTVEDGQVSNLDGPIIIDEGVTVTVKDGGTLVINNWVMNNGKINIEEGGTLYLSDGACLNKHAGAAGAGGCVRSNGLIIVGENAKLIGGGYCGIELYEGSHVVNYGCVASEYFKIANDHTIENRDGGFVLTGAGSAVTGSGSAAYQTPLDYTNKTFAERGTCYTDPYVSLADNSIYSN